MSKQRKITELVGRVVELKGDNKRYLVLPMELREKGLNAILGTIEGRVTSEDVIYKGVVVLMPLDGLADERRKYDSSTVEGTHFIVRNAKPEEMGKIKVLNDSMSLVLDNVKKYIVI